MNVERGGFDSNLLRQRIGLSLGRRATFDPSAHKNIVAIPTFDGDAAILPPIDGYRAAGLQRLLFDFAMAEESIAVAPVTTLQRLVHFLVEFFFGFFLRCECDRTAKDCEDQSKVPH